MLPSDQKYLVEELKRLIASVTVSGTTSETENYQIRLEALQLLAKILR